MAAYEEINIAQGSDIAVEIHCMDVEGGVKDLAGHSAFAKMKRTYTSDNDDTVEFSAIVASPPGDGIITIMLTAAETAALKAGRYVYDVETSHLDRNGVTNIQRIHQGKIFVTPAVTK